MFLPSWPRTCIVSLRAAIQCVYDSYLGTWTIMPTSATLPNRSAATIWRRFTELESLARQRLISLLRLCSWFRFFQLKHSGVELFMCLKSWKPHLVPSRLSQEDGKVCRVFLKADSKGLSSLFLTSPNVPSRIDHALTMRGTCFRKQLLRRGGPRN